jgi:hypothetical protein
MTHILEMFPPSKYVAAFELQGRDTVLTIKSVRAEIIEGENNRKDKRPIVYFEEDSKPLVLNKTNAKVIIKLYGADYAKWPGKRITLFPTKVKAFGEDNVEAVRLRASVPAAAAKATAGKPATLPIEQRAAKVTDAIKKAATVADVEHLWQLAAGLREEVDPDTLETISLTYEARLDEMSQKENA